MIPNEDLLAEIRRLAEDGRPPTSREFGETAEYGINTVRRRFGSWNAGVRAAGYSPLKEPNISNEDLLRQLRSETSGRIAPQARDFEGHCSTTTYQRRFGSWWQAVVRAGLQPHERRPLTPSQFRQFFNTAKTQQRPEDELTTLLLQFTGLSGQLITNLSGSWLVERAGDILIRVPAEQTRSGDRWTLLVPNGWTDGDTRRETGLAGLLQWYFSQHDSLCGDERTVHERVFHVASDANLTNREQTSSSKLGTVPLVRPSDLRATGGIQMARNGGPARRIRRHLGIKHTNWQAVVEDFFLWNHVHHGVVHDQYDPPDIVLNP